MTWNAQDSDGVASTSLTVDGVAASKINGPYTAAAGVDFSGVFGSIVWNPQLHDLGHRQARHPVAIHRHVQRDGARHWERRRGDGRDG